MTSAQLRAALEQMQFRANMREALRLVIVEGFRQCAAARHVGVQRQAVHQALMRFYSRHPEAIPRTLTKKRATV